MQRATKYNLNEETLNFILAFEKSVPSGKVFSNKELVELFNKSTFYNEVIKEYYSTAVSKAIWWAVKRSGSWEMDRGIYTKN
ncbi:hypothetical protein [Virgibacillus litoralis]|uniref:Uncharacterized protein n=1 Tax=Virgibacillus litoralis TaxID=578221 RepID=A0ABS4HEL5_9BACI|nr:hypothetical protein [Virgibacillus litoralis]MBP1949351.1 hypothetical protein [Virgibacillus litoralis]